MRPKMASTRNKTLLLAVVVSLLLPASPVISSIQQRDIDSITKEELLAALRKKALTSKELIDEVQQYGVGFQLTPAIEEEIRSLGKYLGTKGLDDLVAAVRHKYRIPDVALRFVYPKAPVLVIVNQSDSIVRNIKWAVVLWNMDLPDRNDPLPIPIATFDFIRPQDESGPQNLFAGPLVAPLLKPGNRLMGSASLDCPDCVRGRTYFIYIVWGSGGWVSEIESEKSGKLIIPPNFLKETRGQYFQTIEATVPEKSRISISESVQKSPLSTPIPASAKPAPSKQEQLEPISVAFLYENKQIQIHNLTKTEFYLWGSKLGDGPITMEPEPRVVSPEPFYYFIEGFEDLALKQTFEGGESRSIYHLFVEDIQKRKFTLKCLLWATMKDHALKVSAQNLGIANGWLK
jgi:hypothetical protein